MPRKQNVFGREAVRLLLGMVLHWNGQLTSLGCGNPQTAASQNCRMLEMAQKIAYLLLFSGTYVRRQ